MFEGADADDTKGHGGEGVHEDRVGVGDGSKKKRGGRDFSVNCV